MSAALCDHTTIKGQHARVCLQPAVREMITKVSSTWVQIWFCKEHAAAWDKEHPV